MIPEEDIISNHSQAISQKWSDVLDKEVKEFLDTYHLPMDKEKMKSKGYCLMTEESDGLEGKEYTLRLYKLENIKRFTINTIITLS